MFPAQFMVQIPDEPGIRPDHAVWYIIVITVLLIFVRNIEDVTPFVSGMLYLMPAFPSKGKQGLPMGADPDITLSNPSVHDRAWL